MTPAMPHGTRAAYRAGCHCLPCKAASARARSRYRQHPAPLVPADLARAYVHVLIAKGLGVAQQAKLAHVSLTTVASVKNGQRDRLRAATAAHLLAVRAILAQGQRVDASETLGLLSLLLEEGYTQDQIARYLSQRGGTVQTHHRPDAKVTVRTALKVRALARRLLGGEVETC